MKSLAIYILLLLSTLGLSACGDKGKSSSGRNNNRYYNNQIWTTSPNGSNCVYNGFQYAEQFQTGYNYNSQWSYQNGYHPYDMYTPYGDYNYRYRNPSYTNSGCNDLNRLINTQGFYAYQADFRFGINTTVCPLGSRPAGFGWGVICVDDGYAMNPMSYPFSGHRGQTCNVHVDTHCTCRSLTTNVGTNPAVSGICWD